jgi:hypothetical protein
LGYTYPKTFLFMPDNQYFWDGHVAALGQTKNIKDFCRDTPWKTPAWMGEVGG